MAIINSIVVGRSRRSVGNVTLRVSNGRTIASEKVTKNSSKTYKQVYQRMKMKWATLYADVMRPIIDHSFVTRKKYESSYNAFISNAINAAYYTPYPLKNPNEVVLGAGFYPNQVPISRGSMSPIVEDAVINNRSYPLVAEEVSTVKGSGFNISWSPQKADVEKLAALGVDKGEMLTQVVLLRPVMDNSVSKTYVLAYRRIKRDSVDDSKVEVSYNSAFERYFGESLSTLASEMATSGVIVGVALIHSKVSEAGGFDCSTQNLQVFDPDQGSQWWGDELVYSYEETIDEALADSASVESDIIIARKLGWEVTDPLLLNPNSVS